MMQRNVYEEPILEVISMEMTEVICASGNSGDNDDPWFQTQPTNEF